MARRLLRAVATTALVLIANFSSPRSSQLPIMLLLLRQHLSASNLPASVTLHFFNNFTLMVACGSSSLPA